MRLFKNLKIKGFIQEWGIFCGNNKQDMLCDQNSLLTRFQQSKENLDKPCCDNLFNLWRLKLQALKKMPKYHHFYTLIANELLNVLMVSHDHYLDSYICLAWYDVILHYLSCIWTCLDIFIMQYHIISLSTVNNTVGEQL